MKKQIKLSVVMLLITAVFFMFTACKSSDKKIEGTETEGTTQVTTGTSSEGKDTEGFNYSEGITDSGFWKDIRALDYVELCEYMKIPVPAEVHQITDSDIMYELENILYYYSDYNEITDRAVADGDTVNIDYVGSIDGKEFEGGSTGGAGTTVVIGVTRYIDNFLEQLIGHKPGEQVDVLVTFPEDYGHEELNGKDALFKVTINYIIETIMPELTDSFVQENFSNEFGWQDVNSMKEAIRSDLQKVALEEYIQNYVFENSTIRSIPESMMKYQENSVVSYFKDYADYYGMEYEDFLKTYLEVSSSEELLAEYREDNEQAVKMFLIFQAIAEDANISVTEEDVADYFYEYEGERDYSPYEEAYGLPYLKLLVLNQEVINFLVQNANLQ